MSVCAECREVNEERARFCSSCGARLTAQVPEFDLVIRKMVTILFSDLAGSTKLGERHDAEALRNLLGRYFDEMRRVVEKHGGTIEKFIGDAIMAVFGHPVAYEDDAVRAVRAAAEMRLALAAFNERGESDGVVRLEARTGINTGEVVAGDPAFGHAFVTGDAVNTAKRLEEAAPDGEILLGADTLRLVRDAVRVEPLDPLALKGKALPVSAFRLVDVSMEAPGITRRLDAPIVGREQELDDLRSLFDQTVADSCCSLALVLGPAGIGKSRVVMEFVTSVADEVLALRGRCLSYRDGKTFRPVVEVVYQAAGVTETDASEQVREKIFALITERADAERVYDGLAGVLGLGGSEVPMQEIFWAVRKLLESLAAKQPVVVVFEDIHWAEPTFIDLLEYVSGWSAGYPILLCCLARPDSVERLPVLTALHGRALQIRLEPLGGDAMRALVGDLLGAWHIADDVHTYVAESAEGNPLFLEETLEMLIDDGHLQRDGDGWHATGGLRAVRLPPTIQAVLAARLDSLEPDERVVIERAAVVGHVFEWSAVAELSQPNLKDRLATLLQALVRRGLVCPAVSRFASEDGFAFSHGLLRDAAYAGLPKEVRAELHEQYARWLERKAALSTGEYEELTGYHLEQAVRCRRDLSRFGERTDTLAHQAGHLLSVAGKRALGRGDAPAAAKLLQRASELLSPSERAQAMLDLALALRDLGELVRAETVIDDATAAAVATNDVRLEARAQLERQILHIYSDPAQTGDEMVEIVNRAVPVLEEAHDDEGLARAWYLVGAVHWTRCHAGAMEDVLERALFHARRAGSQRELAFVLNGLARAVLVGPMPVDLALTRCTEILEEATGDRTQQAIISIWVALLEAMRGDFKRARDLCTESSVVLEELGQKLRAVAAQGYVGTIELLAGDPVAAERLLRPALDALEQLGERPNRRHVAARLAEVHAQLGHLDDAEQLAQLSRHSAPPDDIVTQVRWRIALASTLARRSDHSGAEQLAREAVSLARATDWLNMCGDAELCLAEVLAAAGNDPDSRVAADVAARLYETKGNLVLARRARSSRTLAATATGADRRS